MTIKDVSNYEDLKTPIKIIKLLGLASACDRTGVSDRATALITSSVI